jgi:hypothetical protein
MTDYYPQNDSIDTVSVGNIDNLSFLGLDSTQSGNSQFVRASASSMKTMFQGGGGYVELNAQTGTTYTVQLSDHNKIVTFDNLSSILCTIPLGIPAGFRCTFIQLNSGMVSFDSEVGVSLEHSQTGLDMEYQYGKVEMYGLGSELVLLKGDLFSNS